ncbi:septum formation initiator family protein [Blochmannia endosymbiont of Colobopsis nipponica]|uniref:septum formation initiator family protein n=1 Tax=Blochmannia endosymbiont of Colobopsis nipponica TaxID=2681987 RepID=UPI0017813602|nr:septum formation initiator family protein [Blochmannia endosymbiont of Colobopsis nipponica]QOI11242.1 septum formation initiator family protein [Blochmannia endosymbiont of Colobopsis nipponica]
MIKFEFVFFVLITYLQYSLWFGKNGVRELYLISDFINHQEHISMSVKGKVCNDVLFAEINDLYFGYDSIEERSRVNLGMIKKGETYYRIVSNTANNI